eukprot:TRINITY_DN573_c0_g1_i2.p1 TRINITY_DN573_c0_g1~~TRINITY_DN573_c0_g1_i2.p1  ORF type:complete len:1752 (-),score=345.81 TRINITY_DN573_c0_g1_i2:358-5613(-)
MLWCLCAVLAGALVVRGDTRISSIQEHGSVRCATKVDNVFFGLRPASGPIRGMDPDLCRAFAAAIFTNVTAQNVDSYTAFMETTTQSRFVDLAANKYDVLLRTTTVTITRESLAGITFSPPYYYDSQGMLVLVSSGMRYPANVDQPGVTYCVTPGSTSLTNAQTRFSFAEPVLCSNDSACFAMLTAGNCSFQTGDKETLAAQREASADPSHYAFIQEPGWTRVPQAAGVLDPCGAGCDPTDSDLWTDWEFNEVVSWVVRGLMLAEFYNLDQMEAAAPNISSLHPEARALLGFHPVTGVPMSPSDAQSIGLPPEISEDFMRRVVRTMGHYGRLYSRNNLTLIGRDGPNRLFNNSGAQYPALWLPASPPPANVTTATYQTFMATAGARQFKCGVKHDSILPAADVFALDVGFDLDYCRAMAASVFSSHDDWNPVSVDSFITQVDYTASNAVAKLLSGEIDALVGWPISIGADMNQELTFSPPIFFDNMAILVPTMASGRRFTEKNVTSQGYRYAINQSSVCICTLAQSVFSLMAKATWPAAQIINIERDSEVVSFLNSGVCDVAVNAEAYLTFHKGRLGVASHNLTFVTNRNTGKTRSLVRVPFGIATREVDVMWSKIVRWLVFGIHLAEEYDSFGVNMDDVLSLQQLGCRTSCPPEVQRLLWLTDFDHGLHGPELGFMGQVIATVGNYGEIYTRNWEQGMASDFPRSRNIANYQWNNADPVNATGVHYPNAWNVAGGNTTQRSPLDSHESAALLALRTSLAIDSSQWTALPSCAWAYLTCISPAGPVASLSASGQLQPLSEPRSLPSVISGLLGLAALELSGVNLSGSLPNEISMLSSLTILRLSNNALTGTIPDLQSMTRLTTLELANNRLMGMLPDFMPTMTQLSVVDLSRNQLVGPLMFLRNSFPKLWNLTLSYNGLGNGTTLSRLPSQISNLPSLVELRLDHNFLDSPLPRGLWSLRLLQLLDLSYNAFSGVLTPDISRLASIRQLNLSHNRLNSTLPPTFGQLHTLTSLDLSNNELVGTVPLSSQMTKLTYVDLSNNRLTSMSFDGPSNSMRVRSSNVASSIDGLQSLSALEYLDLSGNEFGGTLPAIPAGLRHLDLRNNAFTGPIPESWSNVYLEHIYLSGNHLTGRIPSSFASAVICDLGNDAAFECSEAPRCASATVQLCASAVHEDDSTRTIILAVVIPVGTLVVVASIVVIIQLTRPRASFSMDFMTWSQTAQITDIIVNERLGGGLFGDVYKGFWNGHTPVALKKLKDENPQEFENEALILALLTHPNIVQCLGIHTTPANEQYLVTEFCSLGSLDRFITPQKDTLKTTDLLRIAKQAAAGMLHLEEKQIVHRDLALRNLLVKQGDGERFTIKIADFGLARQVDATTGGIYHQEDAIIPIKWSAPETMRNFEWSSKSDVFSFGVVLWELWSAPRVPWSTHSNQEVYIRVLSGQRIEPPPDAPEDIAKLMKQMWAATPADRPTFKQVVTAIQEALDVHRTVDYPNEVDPDPGLELNNDGDHYTSMPNSPSMCYSKAPLDLRPLEQQKYSIGVLTAESIEPEKQHVDETTAAEVLHRQASGNQPRQPARATSTAPRGTQAFAAPGSSSRRSWVPPPTPPTLYTFPDESFYAPVMKINDQDPKDSGKTATKSKTAPSGSQVSSLRSTHGSTKKEKAKKKDQKVGKNNKQADLELRHQQPDLSPMLHISSQPVSPPAPLQPPREPPVLSEPELSSTRAHAELRTSSRGQGKRQIADEDDEGDVVS